MIRSPTTPLTPSRASCHNTVVAEAAGDAIKPGVVADDALKPGAVAVVDPISTGCALAFELATKRGSRVVCVWSDACPVALRSHVQEGQSIGFVGVVSHEGDMRQTLEALRVLGMPIDDVIVGCETGVEFADELSEALGLRGNGTAQSRVRRNKFLQAEAAREVGLDIAEQRLASTEEDVEAFLASHQPTPFKAVVKPVDGAGSEGVHICASPDAVRKAFHALQGSTNCLGRANRAVLLQEFLGGDEYVVDSVSRDGEHKVISLWRYDKRRLNGSGVVYYGMRLLTVDSEPHLPATVAYVRRVLDALGIRNGAVHTEVKVPSSTRGAVLIEANCRLHGGDGCWAPIAERCLGCSQITALCDAYLDADAFDALPALPRRCDAHGAQVDLRSTVEGTLAAIDEAALAAARALPSYLGEVLFPCVAVGARIEKTVDVLTTVGEFNLVNADATQLQTDYDALQAIIDAGIFTVEP